MESMFCHCRFHRARPLIIDPGLYSLQKEDVFWVSEKRDVPSAFKLFTGTRFLKLSKSYVENSISVSHTFLVSST